MLYAASTACRIAAFEKSDVDAWPRRWPMYTVTASPLSRVRSIVSTCRWRTVTDSPVDSLASHDASLAPSERACFNASRARSVRRSSEIEKMVMEWSASLVQEGGGAEVRRPRCCDSGRYHKQR